MPRALLLVPPLFMSLLLAAAGALAQTTDVYKWKDARGVTHYGDAPPPGQGAQRLRPPSTTTEETTLPYELARAVRNHPVTLTTTADCAPCEAGRALLRARGVPFTELTVGTTRDQDSLRRRGGDANHLPLLQVGSRRIPGFEAGAWQAELDAAAYPRHSQLPRGYRQPPAQPVAQADPDAPTASLPVPPPARGTDRPAPDAAAAAAERARPQPATGNAPPGFQF